MNYLAPKVRQVSLRTCPAVSYSLRVICFQNFRNTAVLDRVQACWKYDKVRFHPLATALARE